MSVDNTIDWALGLGVGFMLLGYFVLPQFTNALTAVAGISDNATSTFVTAIITIVLFVAAILWVKGSYKE